MSLCIEIYQKYQKEYLFIFWNYVDFDARNKKNAPSTLSHSLSVKLSNEILMKETKHVVTMEYNFDDRGDKKLIDIFWIFPTTKTLTERFYDLNFSTKVFSQIGTSNWYWWKKSRR